MDKATNRAIRRAGNELVWTSAFTLCLIVSALALAFNSYWASALTMACLSVIMGALARRAWYGYQEINHIKDVTSGTELQGNQINPSPKVVRAPLTYSTDPDDRMSQDPLGR